jgi:hypothetical protein
MAITDPCPSCGRWPCRCRTKDLVDAVTSLSAPAGAALAMHARLEPTLRAAKVLAVLALQSARYSTDGEFQQAVDDVLALTQGVRL